MRIIEKCEKCLYDKQAERVSSCSDSKKRTAYLEEVRAALDQRGENDCSPYMVYLFNKIYAKYFGETDGYSDVKTDGYSDVKKEYNDLVLAMEDEIEQTIDASSDPLQTSIIYARTGNYIDYGVMSRVDKDTFLSLLDKSQDTDLDREAYASFREKCKNGSNLLLLCDNCGEIVLDKLFLRQLRKYYPHLDMSVMVRGGEVLNDVTVQDAEYCGISDEAKIISSGIALGGTVIDLLAPEARQAVVTADVILAKGQGNYEGMSGCGIHAFYSFLCKCDLFTSHFHVPKFAGIFIEE